MLLEAEKFDNLTDLSDIKVDIIFRTQLLVTSL